MSHRTFIESSAVTTVFDWTNMAAALPQFFGAARHPCFEVSDSSSRSGQPEIGESGVINYVY